MIYRELILLHRSDDERKVSHLRVDGNHAALAKYNCAFRIRGYPHWFDIGFMGTQFVAELSAQFLYNTKFTVQHPMELKDFLNIDRFGTLCKPHDHVRFLEVDVTLDLYNSRSGSINI